MTPPSPIFTANLAQLRRTAPALAKRVAAAAPAALDWAAARTGPLAATLAHAGRSFALASRYDPVAEARKLIAGIDRRKHAAVVVLGLGLGYHVTELASDLTSDELLIVFEPDVGLVRAVFERMDHTAWLGRPNVILADDQTDRAALLAAIERYASLLTQGTILITHPPTRQLHGAALNQFGQLVAEVLGYCRTNVATAIVNASRTVRNLARNLPYYLAGAHTSALHGAAAGFPAVCVGAGPSLQRNVHLLADPALRRNVVLISAQTTLKPLLDRGIAPDFVTALDYHEISRRFYEGLPDLPRVTLVAEPKAHPAILDSFPGPVRVARSAFLNRLAGRLAPAIDPIPSGATVAHLSFYLAQHLGCDPIILIGQDLGFSDGLYYCPGTAIHDVWAPELSPFGTVEMFEWQRIVRHRSNLQKRTDVHGRPAYSDEQMLTYLQQFERDFAKAEQTIIDASEGGLPKEHTTRLAFGDALGQYATRPVPPLPLPPRGFDQVRLALAGGLLRQHAEQVTELRQLSVRTSGLLHQMLEHQRDLPRMEKLFEQVQQHRARVDELQDTFSLVNDLNTIGAYKRARADRAIARGDGSELERQEQQIRRDLENLDWLVQACDEALDIFRAGRERIEQFGQPADRLIGEAADR